MRPTQALNWMHDGTERLLAQVAELPDEALGAATALPGWTRAYLLAHIAANADALRNLVHWASTGEERPMYGSTEEREADIAAGAKLPVAELRAWAALSAADLAADLDALDALDGPDGIGDAWAAKIITAQGLTRAASEIPWMRTREIYIHAIDMAAGTSFADLPPDFLAALLDDVAVRRSAVGGGPALLLAAADTGGRWDVAGTGSPVPVTGSLPELAAYLTGRPAPSLPAAPVLPPWL
jgi:maleylpyruvate isomerase